MGNSFRWTYKEYFHDFGNGEERFLTQEKKHKLCKMIDKFDYIKM